MAVRPRSSWPDWPALLPPLLVATGETAAVAPWLPLVAGLTGNPQAAPSPAGVFVVGLAGLGSARALADPEGESRAGLIATGLGLGLGAAWLALTLGNPVAALGQPAGWLVVGAAALAWLRGRALGRVGDLATPARAHRLLGMGVLLVGIALLVAVLAPGAAADAARTTALWAVPLVVVSGLGLAALGVAGTVQTRTDGAAGRGEASALGFALGLLVLAALLVAGVGGAHQLGLLGGLHRLGALLGAGFSWLLVGIGYVGFALVGLVRWLFGLNAARPPGGQVAQNVPRPIHQIPGTPSPILMIVILAVVALLAVLLGRSIGRLLWRLRRRPPSTGVAVERERLWSVGLLLDEVRDALGSRAARRSGPEGVDLRRPPASVREAYRHLLVLAAQAGQARGEAESPRDFARRLQGVWVELGEPLDDLTRCYLVARYGAGGAGGAGDDLEPARADLDRIRVWLAERAAGD